VLASRSASAFSLLFLSLYLSHAIQYPFDYPVTRTGVDKYASTRRLLMQERWRIVSSSAPIYNANTASGQEGWTAIGLMHLSRCISNIRCHATTLAVCSCVLISSGVAMRWAGGGKVQGTPECRGLEFQAKKSLKTVIPLQ